MSVPMKIVVVGDGAVGKTALLHTYTNNSFPTEYLPTVFDNYSALTTYDKRIFNLSLWDSAGQEDYDHLRPLSYPQTDVFLLLFSVISHTSFANLQERWLPEIRHHCPTAAIVLVASKIDLRGDKDVLSRLAEKNLSPLTYNTGKEFATKEKLFDYIEVSALEMTNVKATFDCCIRAFTTKSQSSKPKSQRRNKKCSLL